MKEVTLRALEPEDLDMLYRIENDKELWDIGVTSVPYSRYVLHEFMSSTTGDIYTDKQVRLVIENEGHQIVGMADLMSFDPKNRKAELGLVIAKPYRHQGYARAVIGRIHDYALRTLHLHQLYVVIPAANTASLTLFRSIDYRESSRLSEWLYDGREYHDAIVFQKIL